MTVELLESSDLLANKKETVRAEFTKVEFNGALNNMKPTQNVPPDGGLRAYSVMVGSFLINGILFGVINSYSVIYTVLKMQLLQQGIENAESRASLVGVLTMGTTFLLSPLSGVLTGLLGIRLTAVLGGSVAALGLLVSSFFVDRVNVLCLTYGVMYGLGASLAYTPSLAILGHYFHKYLGLVNGIVTIGSSVFTVIMAPLMSHLIVNYGLDWMFRALSIITFGIALCGLLFKSIAVTEVKIPRESGNVKSVLRTIFSVEIWRNKKYRLWALSMPVALFGYFVPYVHIGAYIESTFPEANQNLPLQCIAVTSGIGRLVFGFLGDKKNVDRIMLQQIAFYVIGTLTIILPFVNSFGLVVAVSLGMGLFDGVFIALIGPIAFELCGSSCAAQAIGCMLGLAAVPVSVGPPVAGHLYHLYNSYKLPFVLAGISPLVGATLMFAIRCGRRDSVSSTETNGYLPTTHHDDDREKNAVRLLNNQQENA